MSLRDALLRAGKVSKKDAQKVATEQRRKRKRKKGHRIDAKRKSDSNRRHKERLEKQQKADRLRVAKAKEAFDAHERIVRAKNIIKGWKQEPGTRRGVYWHFVRSDGYIGTLNLDAELALSLQYGAAGIVEYPDDPANIIVVRREGVVKLLEFSPSIVKFYLGINAPTDPLVNPPILRRNQKQKN